MGENETTCLRRQLEQLTTQQLEDELHAETAKETPDDDKVLLLLRILEERNAEEPVELGAGGEAAWRKYQEKKGKSRKSRARWIKLTAAASFAAVILLVCTIPIQASAGSVWKILAKWTDTIFEYVNLGGHGREPEEYVFKTENPGLQEIYDTVVSELGVTEPVVPQWLPEGYELFSVERLDTRSKISVHACFKSGDDEAILDFAQMKIDFSPEYDKTEMPVREYEVNGIAHNLVRNNNAWLVSWTRQNLKCSIYMDCQEEILREIVRSIY